MSDAWCILAREKAARQVAADAIAPSLMDVQRRARPEIAECQRELCSVERGGKPTGNRSGAGLRFGVWAGLNPRPNPK